MGDTILELRSGVLALALTIVAAGLPARAASGQAAAQTPAAIDTDPAPDAAHPTSNVEISVPSHGEQMYGIFYRAGGAGAHPTALILHGFPGYEQQLDLAQALRRAGWNVLAVHYRGSWGVHGAFSLTHAMEDADAEVAFLERSDVDAKYRIDAKKIVVIGHSMGGYMAASAGAHDPRVAGVVMIGAWDIGSSLRGFKGTHAEALQRLEKMEGTEPADFRPLSGCTPAALDEEMLANHERWDFVNFAPALAGRPVLLLTANDDSDPGSTRLLAALKTAGAQHAELLHTDTDHGFSDHRIFLETTILNWLAALPASPPPAP
jgi:uncharacterized protein